MRIGDHPENWRPPDGVFFIIPLGRTVLIPIPAPNGPFIAAATRSPPRYRSRPLPRARLPQTPSTPRRRVPLTSPAPGAGCRHCSVHPTPSRPPPEGDTNEHAEKEPQRGVGGPALGLSVPPSPPDLTALQAHLLPERRHAPQTPVNVIR